MDSLMQSTDIEHILYTGTMLGAGEKSVSYRASLWLHQTSLEDERDKKE